MKLNHKVMNIRRVENALQYSRLLIIVTKWETKVHLSDLRARIWSHKSRHSSRCLILKFHQWPTPLDSEVYFDYKRARIIIKIKAIIF